MKKKVLLFALIIGNLLLFGQVPTAERDALVALYNSTDGANWWTSTNWNTSEPVSTWYGITVENISGQDHVTYIELDFNGVSGNLIPEFEDLTELKVLNLSDNSITGPIPSELGNCTNLTEIKIWFAYLEGNIPAELANLANLEELILDYNWLSGEIPDIFNSMNLKALGLISNDFTGSINITNTSPDFYYLGLSYSLFSEIDFRNGYNTNIVDTNYFQANDNPNLTCVFVDDATYSTENWTNIDSTSTFVETQAECDAIDLTYVPDDSFEQALIDQGYDDVLDDYVLTENINTVTFLGLDYQNIEDLSGIEDFVALTSLYCNYNQLTSLDLSQNTSLVFLTCDNNQLTTLDVRNGTNSNIINNNFHAENNPDLTCIFVDDAAWSTSNWTNIDSTSTFVETQAECYAIDHTYVPDDSFEQALIDQGYDDVLDDYVLTSNINCFTLLNVSNKDISDLTGIEDFILLIELWCSNNQITTLDVSQNMDLAVLHCDNNQLTTLDVRNGTNSNISNSDFTAYNNPNLTCIFVDDATWSTANWTNIDPTSTFVETQAECDALGVYEAFLSDNLKTYPNPTQGLINIETTNLTDKNYTIYNIYGAISKQGVLDNSQIDITTLNAGIYLLKLGDVAIKIVKL